jgi:preprotein translocase subunit SecF
MKNSITQILRIIVWIFITISVLIMLYSFTQPTNGMKLTMVALVTTGIGFGANMLLKKKTQEEQDENHD